MDKDRHLFVLSILTGYEFISPIKLQTMAAEELGVKLENLDLSKKGEFQKLYKMITDGEKLDAVNQAIRILHAWYPADNLSAQGMIYPAS